MAIAGNTDQILLSNKYNINAYGLVVNQGATGATVDYLNTKYNPDSLHSLTIAILYFLANQAIVKFLSASVVSLSGSAIASAYDNLQSTNQTTASQNGIYVASRFNRRHN